MSDEKEPITVYSCGPSTKEHKCRCTPEKRDCDHDFSTGPAVEFDHGWTSSCSCGLTAISHDMWCGP